MNTQKKWLIPAGIIGAAILAVLIFGLIDASKEKKKKYNWEKTFKIDDKQPYGTYVLHQLLKKYYSDEKPTLLEKHLSESLPQDSTQLYNYVYVGGTWYPDEKDLDSLLGFVARGNRAFIAAEDLSIDFFDFFSILNCEYWTGLDYLSDSSVKFNFEHSAYAYEHPPQFHYQYEEEKMFYRWYFFSEDYWCEEGLFYYTLGTINGNYEPNFIKIPHGKGAFYIHTSPLAFTNYHLIRADGREYAERVFSHLPKGELLWDTQLLTTNKRNNPKSYDSPLQYLLSQAPLRWAWYTSLLLAVLYLVYGARRRQRIIPVLKPNENTSLEFVQSIGRLYFLQKNPRKLVLQKMKLFLAFIRDRYALNTNSLDTTLIDGIVKHSEIKREKITSIFNTYHHIKNASSIQDNLLVEFNRELEFFYSNCK